MCTDAFSLRAFCRRDWTRISMRGRSWGYVKGQWRSGIPESAQMKASYVPSPLSAEHVAASRALFRVQWDIDGATPRMMWRGTDRPPEKRLALRTLA
jgi:hypothetical protein